MISSSKLVVDRGRQESGVHVLFLRDYRVSRFHSSSCFSNYAFVNTSFHELLSEGSILRQGCRTICTTADWNLLPVVLSCQNNGLLL